MHQIQCSLKQSKKQVVSASENYKTMANIVGLSISWTSPENFRSSSLFLRLCFESFVSFVLDVYFDLLRYLEHENYIIPLFFWQKHNPFLSGRSGDTNSNVLVLVFNPGCKRNSQASLCINCIPSGSVQYWSTAFSHHVHLFHFRNGSVWPSAKKVVHRRCF